MSLAEAQQLYSLLAQSNSLLDEMIGKAQQVKTSTEDVNREIGSTDLVDGDRKLLNMRVTALEVQHLARTLLMDFKRMGLGEDAERWIAMFQQIIHWMRMIQLAATALEMSTPFGLAMAAASAVSLGLSMAGFSNSMGGSQRS